MATSVRMPVSALPPGPADHDQRDQREGPAEELRREHLVADGEGEDAGEGGERDELGRRPQQRPAAPDEHVDAGDQQQADPDRQAGDEVAARAGERLRAERVAGADAPLAHGAGDQVGRARHALDLQRPLRVVGDDVGQAVEAAEERQERHDREDEEAGEGVEDAPAASRRRSARAAAACPA